MRCIYKINTHALINETSNIQHDTSANMYTMRLRMRRERCGDEGWLVCQSLILGSE